MQRHVNIMEQTTIPSTFASRFNDWRSANRSLTKGLVFALIMAVVWWLVALWLRGQGIPTWFDQGNTFRPASYNILHPYTVERFYNTPWVLLFIFPFAWLPLEVSMLLQAALLYSVLTFVIFRLGGDFKVVVWTLTSFMSLDATLQMNVEWVVLIGLLVPATYSAPFLAIKPQLALGYYFGVSPKKWLPIAGISIIVLLISFVVWGFWPPSMIAGTQLTPGGRYFNIAPINLLPWPISVAIGVFFAYQAFRKKDEALGILAGFFFVPYFAPYSLPLIFAIVAIKARRLAIIITISMWIIYGGVILIGILQA